MSEFAGKWHQFALSWDLWVISSTPLMLPGPSFRRHCTAFSHLYDDRPSECRHLSDLSLSLDLRGQECGSMLQTSGLGCCCMGIPTCRMLACAFVKSSPPCFSEPLCVHVCVQCWGGGGCSLFLFLVARETPSACVCCCTCQTMAALLSIQSERPRWRFPPSANKGPGHPACLSPPSFPSIPPRLTSPHCWPSWEN